ncbi:MAG: hypothetical protein L3J94_03950 [Gammaproteobacteria bacterium]|nr:hypothetical protein [Gammaproteobacteria bacterium]
MATTDNSILQQEWSILHRDFERYDQYGLLIKVAAIITAATSLGLFELPLLAIISFTVIFWLQEGIWRTVQGRCGDRLLVLEKQIKAEPDSVGMQFYSEWEASRPGTLGTIVEYLRHSARPTVAYPYIILIALALLLAYWAG